jgi:hypothetical protein
MILLAEAYTLQGDMVEEALQIYESLVELK